MEFFMGIIVGLLVGFPLGCIIMSGDGEEVV